MRFKGALLDWRNTLFRDIDDEEWVRSAAASIGRNLPPDEVTRLSRAITLAGKDPEVVAAQERYAGAASAGITTLILPPVPNYAVRGLDIVLRFFE